MQRPGISSSGGWPWLAPLLLLASAVLCQEDWTKCPSTCICRWVMGKKTANCQFQNLIAVPDGLSPETQSLELRGNHIERLNESAFSSVQLVHLHKLLMPNCGLRYLDAKAFRGMGLLIDIDLTGNELTQLHPDTFAQTPRLRVLSLDRNGLKRLEDNSFRDLHYLQRIALSGNQLGQVGRSAFRNLPSLESLKLDGNNLTHLEVAMFEGLSKLRNLELRHNPWSCDCRLGPFRDWAMQRKLVANATVKCALPTEVAGRAWEEVQLDETTCSPPTTTTTPEPTTTTPEPTTTTPEPTTPKLEPRVETVSGGHGEKILKIDGSGPIIIIPRGKRVRLEWNDNSTVLNFE